MHVKFVKLTKSATMPTRGSAKAAGYDLYADTEQDIVIPVGEVMPFYTGIAVQIPDGYVGKIYCRSGLSTRRGLVLANGVGIIDSDYRGNVGIPIRNLSDEEQLVVAHERLAQIIIEPYAEAEFVEVYELDETERGSGGFGSTGRT